MRFIGDTHGKFGDYLFITDGCDESIQVGDFGVGFAEVPDVPSGHKFIRGNHDDPSNVKKYNWIPDGHYENNMFFVGGGESIDRWKRTEGVDWWADEQLSQRELYEIMDKYESYKPSILVSHECPAHVIGNLFKGHIREISPSRTAQALAALFDIHRPELVIFGHYHMARNQTVDGTRFICIPELGWIDIKF